MATNTTIDVIDVLATQHEAVKQLLSEVDTAKGRDLEDRFCELRRMIAVHETAEEEIVYPAVRAAGDKQVADARTAEEAEGVKALATLEKLNPGSSEFTEKFRTFRQAVLDHAAAEERDVFPVLRSSRSAEERRTMARAFELAERAAPTHAHPHKGTSAAANLLTTPVLGIVDRVRDALSES